MAAVTEPVVFQHIRVDDPHEAGPALVTALREQTAVWVSSGGLAGEVQATLDTAQEFFAGPQDRKLAVKGSGEGFWRGYQPVLESELLERFEIGPVDPHAKALLSPKYAAMEGGNLWPEGMPEFREVCTRFYRSLHALTTTILTGIAAELRLPPAELVGWTGRQFSSLVLNSYVPQRGSADEQARLVEHTDHGGITLLALDGTPGLEIEVAGRGWVSPAHRPGELLMLAGEMLQLWTGGRIGATRHRVRPAPAGAPPRTTLVWFHNPSPDTDIVAHGGGPDSPTANAGEFFIARELEYQQSLPQGRRGGSFES